MITVNCDIGERGAAHEIDNMLMQLIDYANIACAGHAGDVASIEYYMSMARKYKVKVAAHIGYRDRENFGRKSMDIGIPELARDCNYQWGMISSFSHIAPVDTVKFHGALYNDSIVNPQVASALACWLSSKGIKNVITLHDSELAKECSTFKINIIPEFFAERTYTQDPKTKQIHLTPRAWPMACIEDVDQGYAQVVDYVDNNRLGVIDHDVDIMYNVRSIEVAAPSNTSICVHSDSEIAVPLATKLSARFRKQLICPA